MDRDFTKDELIEICDNGIRDIKKYMDRLLENPDYEIQKKASKLGFWLKDYCRFLDLEKKFDPKMRKKYTRGDVIKVHLGYRIGSEHGGLHYAVVLDNNNAIASPVLTIVPLSSLKKHQDPDNLHPHNVYLGDEIYKSLSQSARKHLDAANKAMLSQDEFRSRGSLEDIKNYERDRNNFKKEIVLCNKMLNELKKMKKGSVALVNQITTISKLRIDNPKYSKDILADVRVSGLQMQKIESKIKSLFMFDR